MAELLLGVVRESEVRDRMNAKPHPPFLFIKQEVGDSDALWPRKTTSTIPPSLLHSNAAAARSLHCLTATWPQVLQA